MKDGKPVGVWEYYKNKELTLRFDYDSSRIQYIGPDTTRYLVLVDSTWQLKRLNRTPRLLGINAAVLYDVQKQLRYPIADLRANVMGTVVLTYTVDINGNLVNPIVKETPSRTLADEVFRAVENVPLRYLPAVYRGKPVPVKISFVVRFCNIGWVAKTAEKFYSERQEQQLRQLIPSPPGSFEEIILTALHN